MADNQLDVATVTHGTQPLRSRDADGAGKQAQGVDVAPWVPTPGGASVSFAVSTSAATGKSGGGTFTLPAGTTHVVIFVLTNTVYFTEDGSTTPTTTIPSTTASLPLPAGFIGEWPLAMNLNFIASGGAATVVLAPRKYA